MFWKGVWGYLPANIVQGVVGFLTIVLLTRLVEPAEFGLYANVLVQPVILGEPVSGGTILGTMTAEYSPFGSTTVFGTKSEGADVDGFGSRGTDTQQPSVAR